MTSHLYKVAARVNCMNLISKMILEYTRNSFYNVQHNVCLLSALLFVCKHSGHMYGYLYMYMYIHSKYTLLFFSSGMRISRQCWMVARIVPN